MPANRTQKVKRHACDFADCEKAFARPFDLRRHKTLHGEGERQFQCPEVMCGFSAHQKGNLKSHINSRHKKIRLPCGNADCDKTFFDSSSRTKHHQKFHPIVKMAKLESANRPVPIPVHKRVVRHVEENSPDKVQEILNQFSTFTVESVESLPVPWTDHDPSPSFSNSLSDAPSAHLPSTSSVNQLPYEHLRVYNVAHDPGPPWSIPPATFQSGNNRKNREGIQDVAYRSRQITLPGPANLLNEWRRHREHHDVIYTSRFRPMHDSKRRPYLPNLF